MPPRTGFPAQLIALCTSVAFERTAYFGLQSILALYLADLLVDQRAAEGVWLLPQLSALTGSSGVALASSYYDEYDAQGARNMEQDRCVWYGVAWCWAGIGFEVGGVGSESEDGGTQLDGSIHTG